MASRGTSTERMRRWRASRRASGYREFSIRVAPRGVIKVNSISRSAGISPTAALEAVVALCLSDKSASAFIKALASKFTVSPKPSTKSRRFREHK